MNRINWNRSFGNKFRRLRSIVFIQVRNRCGVRHWEVPHSLWESFSQQSYIFLSKSLFTNMTMTVCGWVEWLAAQPCDSHFKQLCKSLFPLQPSRQFVGVPNSPELLSHEIGVEDLIKYSFGQSFFTFHKFWTSLCHLYEFIEKYRTVYVNNWKE